jgi:hypothetical protein
MRRKDSQINTLKGVGRVKIQFRVAACSMIPLTRRCAATSPRGRGKKNSLYRMR